MIAGNFIIKRLRYTQFSFQVSAQLNHCRGKEQLLNFLSFRYYSDSQASRTKYILYQRLAQYCTESWIYIKLRMDSNLESAHVNKQKTLVLPSVLQIRYSSTDFKNHNKDVFRRLILLHALCVLCADSRFYKSSIADWETWTHQFVLPLSKCAEREISIPREHP